MSDARSESFECPRGVDAGAYALQALTDAEGAEYAEHLGHCAACTAEVHVLRSVVDTLPIAAPQVAPSSALKSRIMAVVAAESELLRAAGSETDRAVVPPAPRRRWQSFVPSLRPALAGALACALLAVGVVGGLAVERAGKPETRTLSAWAAGEADAKLSLTGQRASLELSNMPRPPAGQVYQVWLERSGGQLDPSHTLFNVRSDGRAKVAIDESMDGVERILVTAEPSGGSLAPSSEPVITATPA